MKKFISIIFIMFTLVVANGSLSTLTLNGENEVKLFQGMVYTKLGASTTEVVGVNGLYVCFIRRII